MNKQPTILIAFANDRDSYLANVPQEGQRIYEILNEHIPTEKLEHTTIDNFIATIRKINFKIKFYSFIHCLVAYLLISY